MNPPYTTLKNFGSMERGIVSERVVLYHDPLRFNQRSTDSSFSFLTKNYDPQYDLNVLFFYYWGASATFWIIYNRTRHR